jgi:hypothetical protein
MGSDKKEILEGIKTFFIVPDLSLMPEDFLDNFFLNGYQAYYVMDDPYLDIPGKIRVLFSLFPDIIVFFNTERRIGGLDWPAFIRSLKASNGERAKIGVLYGRHRGSESGRAFERTYLYEIGVHCGCIPLDYSKARNLSLLTKVLRANEARGRRRNLRAVCGESCSFNFSYEGRVYRGRVRDVSVSHFSCSYEGSDPALKLYEKVANVQLKLGGVICTVDAVLFIRRDGEAEPLSVFVFRNSRGEDGLDPEVLAKVNAFIQGHFEQTVRATIRAAYDEEIARRREERRLAGEPKATGSEGPGRGRLDTGGSPPP